MSTTQGYEHVPVPRGPFVIRLHKNLANRSEGEAVIRVEATRNYDFDMDKETCIDWIATWAIWEFQKLYGLFQETIRLNERESTLPKWQFNQEVDDIIRRVMCATVKYGAVLQIVHVEADLGSTTVPYISSVLNERLEEATDNNYSVVQEMGFEVLESQIGKEVIPVTMYF